MFGNYADAAAIGMHGPPISAEIVNLADQNERIAKAVDYLLEAGPYAGLVTAVLPLVLQLLANHNRIPADKVPGVLPPEALAAKMQAEVSERAMREYREAQDAQRRLEALRAESLHQDTAPMPNGSQGQSQGRTEPTGRR